MDSQQFDYDNILDLMQRRGAFKVPQCTPVSYNITDIIYLVNIFLCLTNKGYKFFTPISSLRFSIYLNDHIFKLFLIH